MSLNTRFERKQAESAACLSEPFSAMRVDLVECRMTFYLCIAPHPFAWGAGAFETLRYGT
jgi:hypothetical protein